MTGAQSEDYVRALEEECAQANTYIGLLRLAAMSGDKPNIAAHEYPPYVKYRTAREHRFYARAMAGPAHSQHSGDQP